MSDWVIRLIDATGYAGVFFLMALETIFPPVPSEVILPVAGVRAANGSMTLGGVILSGTAGAMAGNFFWYLVARRIGLRRFRWFIEHHGRWLTMDWYDVERVERLFGRFGAVVVAIGRLIPTIRSVVSIPAGLVHMALVKFLIWSTIGTVAWSSLLAVAGYLLGQRVAGVEAVLGPVSSGIVAAIVLLYIYRQLSWHRRRVTPADERSDRRP